MTYLLDTNAWIDFLSGRYPTVAARVQDLSAEDLLLSSVVVAELRFGADRSASPMSNHERIDRLLTELPSADFNLAAAVAYGRIRSRLEGLGTPIGPIDMFIAAHAVSLGAVLVTDNVREFQRVDGLAFENWRDRF